MERILPNLIYEGNLCIPPKSENHIYKVKLNDNLSWTFKKSKQNINISNRTICQKENTAELCLF